MKLILLFFLFFFEFTSFTQDTLLLVGSKYYENNSLVRSTVTEYNDQNLSNYSISINYKRQDTVETYSAYDEKDRMTMWVVNGPYNRSIWDTTHYEYRHDTTATIQRHRNRYFRMEEDGFGRRFLTLSVNYDDTGRVYKRTVDSTFYDDVANTQITRSYLMEDYPVLKSFDDEIPPVGLISEPKKKNGLALHGTTFIRRNEQGGALEMIVQFGSGAGKHCSYAYDSLGRNIRTEINSPDEKKHDVTEYEYHISGDTLIQTSWKTDLMGDGVRKKRSVSYSSVEKIKYMPHWNRVFVEGELIHEGYAVFNEQGLIIKDFRRRKRDDGTWIETTTIYEYKKFEKR